MKKLLAVVALVAAMFVAGNVQAQMSIHAGYAPETIKTGNSATNLNGFFAGVDYNMGLAKGLGLSLGGQLRLNTESGSSSIGGIAAAKHTTTQLLLDIPVLLNYGFDINRDAKISVFAGPTINFGLVSKTKYEGNVLGFGGSSTVDWYNQNGLNYKRFNLSGTAGLAFTFKQFRIFGGYNYGFLDLDNASSTTTNTAAPFFGIGYTL